MSTAILLPNVLEHPGCIKEWNYQEDQRKDLDIHEALENYWNSKRERRLSKLPDCATN
jgi:hypothetical protein